MCYPVPRYILVTETLTNSILLNGLLPVRGWQDTSGQLWLLNTYIIKRICILCHVCTLQLKKYWAMKLRS